MLDRTRRILVLNVALAAVAASCADPVEPRMESGPAAAFERPRAPVPVIEVRSIAYVAGKGVRFDIGVAHSVVLEARGDVTSEYLLELAAALRQFKIMGDLPTATVNIALADPVSSVRGVDIFRVILAWNGELDGTSVTGEVDVSCSATLTRYAATSIQLLGQTSGTGTIRVP
jgi:hypothetical protein